MLRIVHTRGPEKPSGKGESPTLQPGQPFPGILNLWQAENLPQHQAFNQELHSSFGISHAMARVGTDLDLEALAGLL